MTLLGQLLGQKERNVTIQTNGKSISTWLNGLFSMPSDTNTVNEANIYGLTAVWRAIRVISENIAKTPLSVYYKQDDGDIVEAKDHPAWRLLNKQPSHLYTSFSWRESVMHRVLVRGNGLSRIFYNRDGAIKEIRLIDNTKLQEIFELDGALWYKFSGEDKPVPAADIIHIMGPTENGIWGLNPIEAHRDTFSSDMGSQKYAKTLWENGAMPSAVLENPAKMSDSAYNKLKSSFHAEYAGAKNAGKVIILEEGTSYKPIALNPVDSRWIESRKNVVEDVSRIYGVPLHMLSQLEAATFNNITQLTLLFVKDCLQPWMSRWTAELDRKLFSQREQFKYYTAFDTTGLLESSIVEMVDAYQKLFNIGTLNRNEIRGMMKKNRVEDGDRYFVQGNNMVPVDLIDELAKARFSGAKDGDLASDTVDVPTVTEKG